MGSGQPIVDDADDGGGYPGNPDNPGPEAASGPRETHPQAATATLFGYDLQRASLTIEADDPGYAADPADSVVAVGERPAVATEPPVRGRVHPPMPTDRLRGWIVAGVLTLIGAFVRFWQLGLHTDGGTPLFDGKYYAIQAAEMIRTGGVEDNQGFSVIVHPPLGKQIIAIFEEAFGYNSIGWRLASAIGGTLAILIIIRSVRRMTRSTLIGAIAGVLLICDGVSQVMSQIALMDSLLVPFVLGAFACLLVDRDQVRARLATAVADGSMNHFTGGVPLGARWWRFGCGFLLGCATAIKWNGAYWVVGFGIMSVIWDICARRDYGVRGPVSSVTRRDLLPSLWSLGVVPVVTYIGWYWAWFSNETGWDRHAVDAGRGIVGALRSLTRMTGEMLQTSAGILTPTNPADRHPWESKPFSWPLSARPLLTFLSSGTTGCGPGRHDCVQRILIIGTPILWWASLFVAAWALWRAVGRVDWRFAAVLVAYGAGYLPWFTIFNRQMYFFYMAPVAPFLVIGITLVLGDVLGRGAPTGRRFAFRRRPPPTGDASHGYEGYGYDANPGETDLEATTESEYDTGIDYSPPDHHMIPERESGFATAPASGSESTAAAVATRPAPAAPRRPSGVRALVAWVRSWDSRTVRLVIVAAYLGLVVADFIWMWPILMGVPITPEKLHAETWIPSWG